MPSRRSADLTMLRFEAVDPEGTTAFNDAATSFDAVTLDFFNTLVLHTEGRGRGRVLMQYLEDHDLHPRPWEHARLYQIFENHDHAYSPDASRDQRQAYYVTFAERVFECSGIEAPPGSAPKHAEALWQILGPSAFQVFPDALDALHALNAAGMPIAIVSNWQRGLRHFCTELGLAGLVDQIIGSADFGIAKPDERIFVEAGRRLGVPLHRVLHVGDTHEDDFRGATAAGMQALLLDRNQAANSSSRGVVRSLTEMTALLGIG